MNSHQSTPFFSSQYLPAFPPATTDLGWSSQPQSSAELYNPEVYVSNEDIAIYYIIFTDSNNKYNLVL